jgi:hypothetical protein
LSAARPFQTKPPAVFPAISLQDFRYGVRVRRRWRDYETGLSKSSVAAAIKEALASGILVQQRNKSATGRDLPSLCAIKWDRVQELDWATRRNLKRSFGSGTSDITAVDSFAGSGTQ